MTEVSRAELEAGLRFLLALPAFIRRPVTVDQARAVIRHRLDRRADDLLGLLDRAAFTQPTGPYGRLLRAAGCERGDLQRLVEREGVEATLRALYRAGVYLTIAEFKGRQPVVRGSLRLAMAPGDLANPAVRQVLTGSSGGSRGGAATFGIGLPFLRDRSYHRCIQIAAHGGFGWRYATWGVPGGATIGQLLQYAVCGALIERWFSQVDPASPELAARYEWSIRLLRLGARLGGRRLPRPEPVPLDDPAPIVRWLADVLAAGDTPYLFTFASAAVRVCRAAEQARIRLQGAHFSLGGEPVTAARVAAIERLGAQVSSNYSIAESGRIGQSCLSPAAPDDQHLLTDLIGLIQAGAEHPESPLPPRALLTTSLRDTAPLLLLNVSMGDEADLTSRDCGCPYQAIGYRDHLSSIRSFEKLTAAGMTFQDADVIRVLEERLPARFGGGPTDYQLVESADAEGLPILSLLVHPSLGPLDELALRDELLNGLAQGDGPEQVMALQWRQGGLLQVRREPPCITRAGKILHLHQQEGEGAPRLPGRIGFPARQFRPVDLADLHAGVLGQPAGDRPLALSREVEVRDTRIADVDADPAQGGVPLP